VTVDPEISADRLTVVGHSTRGGLRDGYHATGLRRRVVEDVLAVVDGAAVEP
jgi:hypothetical protein